MVDRILVGGHYLDELEVDDGKGGQMTERKILNMPPDERDAILRSISNVYGAPTEVFAEEDIKFE